MITITNENVQNVRRIVICITGIKIEVSITRQDDSK